MKIMSIDPSCEDGGLGYAVLKSEPPKLLDYGTVHTKVEKDEPLERKTGCALRELHIILDNNQMRGKYIVIEMPGVWGGFKAAMSTKTGRIHELFFFVGALWKWCYEVGCLPVLIPTREWKGQLPKKVTRDRVNALFNIKVKNTHEGDAIGLGLYYLAKTKKAHQ